MKDVVNNLQNISVKYARCMMTWVLKKVYFIVSNVESAELVDVTIIFIVIIVNAVSAMDLRAHTSV